jgi:predicted DNA-binding transcriptional regulator
MMTLDDILESDLKTEILAFLLLSAPRATTLSEITKRLMIAEKEALEVLEEFLEFSFIKEFQSKSGLTFYIVNPKHKLLPEIRTSLQKNQKPYIDEFYEAVLKLGKLKAAFLSGVFVGQVTLPVDLLLVGEVSPDKLEKFLEGVKSMLGTDINYSVMSVDEFVMRRDTFDRFLRDVFDYPFLTILDDTADKPKAK